MNVRWCKKCQQECPTEQFRVDQRYKAGRATYCRNCMNKAATASRRKDPERRSKVAKRAWLKKLYGITLGEYETLLIAQGHRCAICGGTGRLTVPKQRYLLQVDHDHETGKIRGLLCNRCNTILGNAQDEPEVLRMAIVYLEKHSG